MAALASLTAYSSTLSRSAPLNERSPELRRLRWVSGLKPLLQVHQTSIEAPCVATREAVIFRLRMQPGLKSLPQCAQPLAARFL